jgi:hypothetical protein
VNLAPQVAPLPTPADKLPLAMLKVPRNFHVEVYASGMPQALARIDDKGTLFVSTRALDRIYAVVDRTPSPVRRCSPACGAEWHSASGTLYIAELNKI